MFPHPKIRSRALMSILTLWMMAAPYGRGEPAENQDNDQPMEVTLGITSMSFSGDMVTPEKGPTIYGFSSEPKIRKVDPEGPAGGILQAGDVIVAIDGYLITTREGGMRFGNPAEGKPVTLTVRRWGAEKDVVIVPKLVPQGRSSRKSSSFTFPSPATRLERPNRPSAGWLGLGLSCRGMTLRTNQGDLDWKFDDFPLVYSVDSDGPAERSGIRKGDLLLSLDGRRLNTEEGSRRFSDINPGQELLWIIKRAGKELEIRMRAETTPSFIREEAGEGAGSSSTSSAPKEIKLRWAGSLGRTRIEVRGSEKKDIRVDREPRKISIFVGDATVSLWEEE